MRAGPRFLVDCAIGTFFAALCLRLRTFVSCRILDMVSQACDILANAGQWKRFRPHTSHISHSWVVVCHTKATNEMPAIVSIGETTDLDTTLSAAVTGSL